jgi:hypothetical protein
VGSYTSLAFYSNTKTKINITNWIQIKTVLSDSNENLSNSQRHSVVLDSNFKNASFNKNSQNKHFNVSQSYNNYNRAKTDQSNKIIVTKHQEKNKHFLVSQSKKSQTKKGTKFPFLNVDYLVDTLDLSFPNFQTLPYKLTSKVNQLKPLKPNLLFDSSAPIKLKHPQTETLYSKNNHLTQSLKNDHINQEKLPSLSLFINEDHLDTNEQDDILSVPHDQAFNIVAQVDAVKMNSSEQTVTIRTQNQTIGWTPLVEVDESQELYDAVTWRTRGQAVKSGPHRPAVNWDRQDQQQTSGTSQYL